jgi:cold shock CspA family protein
VTASKKLFDRLKNIRVPAEVRNRLLYPLPQDFQGKIVKIESSYVFIARDGVADWIYCHVSNVDDEVWNQLTLGTRVSFKISFGLRGANAHAVTIIGRQLETSATQIRQFKKESA